MNDFVPIELVRRPLDRFRCDPYHAVITAQTCLMRQERCARGTNAELLRRGHEGGDYARCTPECPLGAKIRENVSLPPTTAGGMGGGMAARNHLPPVSGFSRSYLNRMGQQAAETDSVASAGPMPKPALRMGKKRKKP